MRKGQHISEELRQKLSLAHRVRTIEGANDLTPQLLQNLLVSDPDWRKALGK